MHKGEDSYVLAYNANLEISQHPMATSVQLQLHKSGH